MGECLPWALLDRDHRGMGEAPPWIYLLCDDHSVEDGRPTSGNQTTSLGTPCSSCLHPPQKQQWKGSLVVRNMSDSQIFLKKGVPVVWVVSASLVPPTELPPELEAMLGKEPRPEALLVAARQEKLLEKLNLDGLTHWSPENVVAVRELVLAYHDVFTLESNELGCTSTIEHEIRIENDEPFKEWFQCIPRPSWRRYAPLSEICWKQEQFIRANPHGATQLSWSGRRMVPCISAWTSDASMHV